MIGLLSTLHLSFNLVFYSLCTQLIFVLFVGHCRTNDGLFFCFFCMMLYSALLHWRVLLTEGGYVTLLLLLLFRNWQVVHSFTCSENLT